MTVLCDKTVQYRCTHDDNKAVPLITPFNLSRLSAASYDVALGPTFASYDPEVYSMAHHLGDDVMAYLREYPLPVTLHPGGFILVRTHEWVNVPSDLVMAVWGKSKIGRMGLQVHNAGWIDPGFRGHIVLELQNQGPLNIELWEGDPIAQVALHHLDSEPLRAYGHPDKAAHYQDQKRIQV